jgi:hypothetical protein
MGTVMVFYGAFVNKLVTYEELIDDLAKLSRAMWISEVTTHIISLVKKVKE